MDRRLLQDNAKAVLLDPTGSKVLRFCGRENATKLEFGPISQPGVFQGIPIKVGGENDPVPVHLEDGKDKTIVLAKRSWLRKWLSTCLLPWFVLRERDAGYGTLTENGRCFRFRLCLLK